MGELKKNLELVIAISKGIARDFRVRRTVLLFVISAAVLMVFAGSVLFARFLGNHPLIFLAYWGLCLWLTLLSVLMALYDLLMLRKTAKEEKKRLKEEIFGVRKREEDDSNP